MFGFFMRSERVIIVDDDDNIRTVTIGPRQRLRPALLAVAALSGMLVASAGWMVTAFALRDSRDSIFQMDQGAANLATQLSDSREQLSRVAGDLDRVRQALDAALAEQAESRARTDAALAVLANADKDGSKTPRQVLAAIRNELAPLRINPGEGTEPLRAAQESLQMITDIGQEAAARRAQSAIAALSLVLEEAGSTPSQQPTLALATEGLGKALAEAQAQAQRARADAESAWTERNEMAAAMAESERRLADIAAGQVALLTRLTEHAELRIGAIEGELKNTGLNLDKVLHDLEQAPRGVGGPLVSLTELPSQSLPAAAQAALNQLESRLDRQARLRALANYLPLTPPVDNFYVSSGFGSRRDPFTNQWAAHTGLDLVAKEGSPVAVPAAGRVAAVTYDEGYGHMVEV
ncbi:M23 family metallopeptidase, partial [Niveispirillum sp.]|uniref:M23 family metallopeptidase n=1 Tax=Niveispirillum sp. TaxID=1917217 RepID=UPI001B516536